MLEAIAAMITAPTRISVWVVGRLFRRYTPSPSGVTQRKPNSDHSRRLTSTGFVRTSRRPLIIRCTCSTLAILLRHSSARQIEANWYYAVRHIRPPPPQPHLHLWRGGVERSEVGVR